MTKKKKKKLADQFKKSELRAWASVADCPVEVVTDFVSAEEIVQSRVAGGGLLAG